jgi:hypothetical protein
MDKKELEAKVARGNKLTAEEVEVYTKDMTPEQLKEIMGEPNLSQGAGPPSPEFTQNEEEKKEEEEKQKAQKEKEQKEKEQKEKEQKEKEEKEKKPPEDQKTIDLEKLNKELHKPDG